MISELRVQEHLCCLGYHEYMHGGGPCEVCKQQYKNFIKSYINAISGFFNNTDKLNLGPRSKFNAASQV